MSVKQFSNYLDTNLHGVLKTCLKYYKDKHGQIIITFRHKFSFSAGFMMVKCLECSFLYKIITDNDKPAGGNLLLN